MKNKYQIIPVVCWSINSISKYCTWVQGALTAKLQELRNLNASFRMMKFSLENINSKELLVSLHHCFLRADWCTALHPMAVLGEQSQASAYGSKCLLLPLGLSALSLLSWTFRTSSLFCWTWKSWVKQTEVENQALWLDTNITTKQLFYFCWSWSTVHYATVHHSHFAPDKYTELNVKENGEMPFQTVAEELSPLLQVE